ncbi:cyclic nucleotide-binding domain-containing protein [Telmatospirillum sp. J64-1]|uniref:cyclic nucleotide-binding domain-containing protein n=1 Tax=Telmatospirillum sp. J64-1 TaxID=2502183 RepID=UPI00115DC367|nr:cyclic nucleotide-binding domain-containing protein [Telmatospirillum sp. J64-1]
MRKVLYILGQLDDRDVDWFARIGVKRRVPAGQRLITQGQPINSLYIVIEGHLAVTVNGVGRIASIGAGEVVGEMSFVDSAPPSASVDAEEECVVLELSRRDLTAKLASDPGFMGRFYKAMALFLADRLRNSASHRGYGEDSTLATEDVLEDELDDAILDSVSQAGDRFDRLIKTLSSARLA